MVGTNEKYSKGLGKKARQVSHEIRSLTHNQRQGFLRKMASLISASKGEILRANQKDLELGAKQGLSSAMLDRLALDPKRIAGIVKSVKEIASLPDPLGKKLSSYIRKDKLKIERFSVPIGSIFFIFESRPNVTVDGAALCLKSGNTVILRGGKESAHSNTAFVKIIRKALSESGISPDAVQLVKKPDYDIVNYLLLDMDNIDLVIPRGGERLIKTVVDHSRIPVIKHYKGVCHIYVDKSAVLNTAIQIILNAKTQRPGVCNALETLLIDKHLPTKKISAIFDELQKAGVELRGCPQSRKIKPNILKASTIDWDEEYLDLRLSVKLVTGVDGAIEHIKKYGSGHTDAVLAQSVKVQQKFLQKVDSSSVMINASTRFSDGGEYGLGAEVGISTDKLHARGPMGIESLTTYQWKVVGKGHVRH